MKKNVLIATPALDTVDTCFYVSMVRMMQKHPEYDVLPEINSTIYHAKDSLAFYAMQNKYDYIVFIDTDEVFEPDMVEELIRHDKDIVAGVCCKRAYPYEPMLFDLDMGDEKNPWRLHENVPKTLFEVDAIGGGALLTIKTTALRQIYSCTGDLFYPINHWGEDISFFYRAWQCGIKAYCDGRVQIGHRGVQTIMPYYWRGYGKESQED